jgi:Fanconi anemia group J protein
MGITPESCALAAQTLESSESNKDERKSQPRGVLQGPSLIVVEEILSRVQYMFAHADSYCMVIEKFSKTGPTKSWEHVWGLWCMNPAVAFEHVRNKARSIIFASGTLSPLDWFANELATPFDVKMEGNHIIGPHQLWVGVVPRLAEGVAFNSTFKNNDNIKYHDAVGEALAAYCQAIPSGVLCFLPSYSLLAKLRSRWQQTGLWDRLNRLKPIIVEPQTARDGDFPTTLATFYKLVRERGGALFLAVCRGKVSEGIDFSNENARGVIVVGIPFPLVFAFCFFSFLFVLSFFLSLSPLDAHSHRHAHSKDLKVVLKKQFNDRRASGTTGKALSGKE